MGFMGTRTWLISTGVEYCCLPLAVGIGFGCLKSACLAADVKLTHASCSRFCSSRTQSAAAHRITHCPGVAGRDWIHVAEWPLLSSFSGGPWSHRKRMLSRCVRTATATRDIPIHDFGSLSRLWTTVLVPAAAS